MRSVSTKVGAFLCVSGTVSYGDIKEGLDFFYGHRDGIIDNHFPRLKLEPLCEKEALSRHQGYLLKL